MKPRKLWWRLLVRYHRETVLIGLLCAVQVVAFCQSWFLVDQIAVRRNPEPPLSSSVERPDTTTALPTRRLGVESSQQYISKDIVKEWLSSNAQPPETPGAFLHLGKTGGSTLSSLLRNGCHSHIPKPCHEIPETEESHLSRFSTYYHMPDFPKLINQTSYTFYTLTLRDPLDRTISSLVYTHPANQELLGNKIRFRHKQFFTPCFPDLNVFASSLHHYNTSAPRRNDKCSRSAYRSLHNQVKWVEHLFYDNRYMVSQAMVPNRTVLVIRMEHLANDWVAANEYLGQTNIVRPELYLRQHNDTMLPIHKNSLSHISRQYLCDALTEEYSVYLQLIWRAQNLGARDRHEAYERAKQQCPRLELKERELDRYLEQGSWIVS